VKARAAVSHERAEDDSVEAIVVLALAMA